MTFHINDLHQKSKREILEVWDEAKKYMGEQDKRIEQLEEIALAVGNVGIDFGYGKYELDDATIAKARELTNKEGAE